jgi:hypothetical protein
MRYIAQIKRKYLACETRGQFRPDPAKFRRPRPLDSPFQFDPRFLLLFVDRDP